MNELRWLEAVRFIYHREHATPDLRWHQQWLSERIGALKKQQIRERRERLEERSNPRC